MALKLKPKAKKVIAKKLENGDRHGAMKVAKKELLANADPYEIPDFLKRKPTVGGPSKRVMFKCMGGKVVKKAYFRQFDTVKEASVYFLEFANTRKYNVSTDGTVITFPGAVDSIISNMAIKDVLANKPIPKAGLPILDGYSEDLIKMPKYAAPGVAPKEGERPAPTRPASVKAIERTNGKLIPLKVICADHKVEPRDARMKLRRCVKDPKKYPKLHASHAANARWEWEAGSDALAEVITIVKELA